MNNGVKSPTEVPLASVVSVPVTWLVLDPENPRLVSIGREASETAIIAQLYRAEDLSELLQSIAANGYLDIEPLIVLEKEGHLIVLEGNRRLAAIRLFREPELATRVSDQERIRITLPDISDEHRPSLDSVSVHRVADRKDAWPFIGFKHINGAAKWESYAKAKFAADWYRDGSVSLADIAAHIGDKHDTIKRMVNAIYVLEQADTADIFHIEDRAIPRFNFSHLYTALSRSPYIEFLGLEAAWSRFDPSPAPIPGSKLDQLREILKWLYGSQEENVSPVVQSQNPDIKHLGEVLTSSEALTVLRTPGTSLVEAHASTQPPGRKFSEALVRARQEVREALNNLRGFDERDTALVGIANEISETAQALYGQMKKRVQNAEPGSE